MRILVTGAAGYIGSVLCRKLLEKRYDVIGVDCFRYGNQSAIADLLDNRNFDFRKKGVLTLNQWDYKEADIIIPLAAAVGAPACDRHPHFAKLVNQDVIVEMMRNLSKQQRVIYPNTNSGYGTAGEGVCTEESPLKPISLYGVTKCAGEKAVLEHPNSVSLRLATVCGVSPRMRFDLMLNDFCAKMYYYNDFVVYEPHYKRNFVHVQDVAAAFCWMIEKELTGVYNVGHPDGNMTKDELLDNIFNIYRLERRTYKYGDGRDPDQRNYEVSNDKILSTGFRFNYSMDRAIREIESLCNIYDEDEIRKMGNV